MKKNELKQGLVSHLRMHSHYSVGQSASTPEELISEINRINSEKYQIAAAALTDFNSLSGSLKFSKSAESMKTSQPIIGYDCKIALSRHGKGVGRILLLAMNQNGFKRLCDIQMLAYKNIEKPSDKNDGENPFLALLLDDLFNNNEDIIVLSGKNEEGLFYQLYKQKGHDFALDVARKFLKVFGDRFYIEFCRNALGIIREENGIYYDERHQSELFLQEIMRGGLGDVMCNDGISRSYVMPVATSDIWYSNKERHLAWKIMQADYQHLNLTVSGVAPMLVPSNVSADTIKSTPPYFMNGVGERKIHLDDIDRYHIKTREEMEEIFSDMPYAIDNANSVASRCYFHPKVRSPVLPPFKKIVNGKKVQVNEEEELHEQSYNGLIERIKEENIHRERIRKDNAIDNNTDNDKYRVIKLDKNDSIYKEYIKRLEMELGIILSMGFPGYFLIVSDFIKWSKKQNIPVGPGRGSGAGSLVAYCLRIVDIDPMKYNLLFERFLNPERVSMPDFDIDFCQTRRDEVIKYVSQNYGSEQVSQIATFGQIKPKSSIGVIQRSLIVNEYQLTVNDTSITSKALSSNPTLSNTPLYYYYQDNNWLSNKDEKYEGLSDEMRFLLKNEITDSRRNIYVPLTDKDKEKFNTNGNRIGVPKVSVLMNYGSLITGLYKSRGAHAAGVIIGGEKLTNLFPTMLDEATLNPISAYDQKDSEASGAVKFDFLGLKNLTIIQDAVDYAKEFSFFYKNGFFSDNGKPNNLKIDNIQIDDPHVFKTVMGDNIRTCGIFQLSSSGMQSVIKKIKPETLAHICAINALYRPGPMKYIDSFAKRRNGHEKIVYPGNEKDTKPILEETFGYMIYQEQVMQVAQKVAGYSLGGADLLRRAMGKKIASEMDRQRAIFIHGDGDKTEGAVKHSGMTENAANKLFDDINAFANYGFNKSHSLAYSLISYQTMWLKTYYPACFLSAVASYEKSLDANEYIVNEARSMGIPVLGPDVNKSRLKFCPEVINDNVIGIRYGFSGLKRLVNFDPQKNKPKDGYVDIIDFIVRNHPFNKANIEQLINSGALDSIGFNVNGWNSLSDIDNDNTIEYSINNVETKINDINEQFEQQKEKIKELRRLFKKAEDQKIVKKDIDDAVEKRDFLKQAKKEMEKKLKSLLKRQEITKEEQDALAYKGSLVSIINETHDRYNEELKDDSKKYNACGRVRAILKAIYSCFNDIKKIINPMIKNGVDVDDIINKVRIELLKSEDIKKAYMSPPIRPVDVMVSENGVFEWYFNVHPLIVNKNVFKSVGAYPSSAWIKYLRKNNGVYPVRNVFTNLMEKNTPNYALIAGMVVKEPRIIEREYYVNVKENGISKKVIRKKQRLSVTITDHHGVNINCGYDFDIPEYNESEYLLEKHNSEIKKQTAHMEVRDRYTYLYNILKRCHKSKRPVVLKGSIMLMNGGSAWFSFSWAVQIDDVLDRIPGRNLLITIDENSIVNQNNLDLNDVDDMKKIDIFYERTLRSIRKEVFLSIKNKLMNQSKNSVFLRNKRTKNITVIKNIESGGGSNIVIARKNLNGNVNYFFLNKSDDKGNKINNEYYNDRYMIGDSVKAMISGKPYVSSAEFTNETFNKENISKD